MAAHRGGITTVLIPDENTKDLVEIPQNIKEKLEIKPVKWIDEVLQVAMRTMPQPVSTEAEPANGDKARLVAEGEKQQRARRTGKRAH